MCAHVHGVVCAVHDIVYNTIIVLAPSIHVLAGTLWDFRFWSLRIFRSSLDCFLLVCSDSNLCPVTLHYHVVIGHEPLISVMIIVLLPV